eukprot:Gb_39875 [translate_table: standard]
MAALADLVEHQAGNGEEGRTLDNGAGSRVGRGVPERGAVVLEQVAEQRRSQGGCGAPNGAADPRREWDRVARPCGECRRVAQQLGGRGYCAATKRSLKTFENSTGRHKNALTQKSCFGTLWSLKPE